MVVVVVRRPARLWIQRAHVDQVRPPVTVLLTASVTHSLKPVNVLAYLLPITALVSIHLVSLFSYSVAIVVSQS